MKYCLTLGNYVTKRECFICRKGGLYSGSCNCDEIYLLDRVQISFDEPLNKDTIYHITIENNREVSSKEYSKDSYLKIPLKDYTEIDIIFGHNDRVLLPYVSILHKILAFGSQIDSFKSHIKLTKKKVKLIERDIDKFIQEILSANKFKYRDIIKTNPLVYEDLLFKLINSIVRII